VVVCALLAVALLAVGPLCGPVSGADGIVEEPAAFKTDNYRTPVPKTLAGAAGVLTADQAKALHNQGQGVFIDVYPRAPKPPNLPAATVWREPPHRSILGAVWVPNVGYGVAAAETQAYFERSLAALTKGDKARPVIFFCLRDCWMSWNAAKRAMTMGYSAVYWFSEGTDAWEEHGYPLAIIEPLP
jgi:PQQ-dependent catabolism-associated CXXCW motif protein